MASKMMDKFKGFFSNFGNLRRFFRDEESRFRMVTGLKVMLLPLITLVFTSLIMAVLLRLDHIFFRANGYLGIEELEEVYYEFIFEKITFIIPYLGISFIFLFLAGHYIAGILIRPFRNIGEYCQKSVENEKANYRPELFCDFSLLTAFGEFFFQWLAQAKREKVLTKSFIPPWVTKVHGPVFEKVFFINFTLFIYIICSISSTLVYRVMVEIHDQIIQLAIRTLSPHPSINFFLQEQSSLFNIIVWGSVFCLVVSYLWLSLHLYGKVSGAAFCIFSTMRSFMKGNFSARVHLVGFNHVRECGRYLNKYLDYMEKQFASGSTPNSQTKGKGQSKSSSAGFSSSS